MILNLFVFFSTGKRSKVSKTHEHDQRSVSVHVESEKVVVTSQRANGHPASVTDDGADSTARAKSATEAASNLGKE